MLIYACSQYSAQIPRQTVILFSFSPSVRHESVCLPSFSHAHILTHPSAHTYTNTNVAVIPPRVCVCLRAPLHVSHTHTHRSDLTSPGKDRI